MIKRIVIRVAVWGLGLLAVGSVSAGSLDPTSAPGQTMRSLEEIYQKVDAYASPQTLSATTVVVSAGYYAATTLTAVDTDLATTNIKAGTMIFGVAGKTEVVDTTSGDAVAGEVMSGKKAWVDGSEVTGTIAAQTLSPANGTVAAGYYAPTNLTQVDADLATANIKAGTTIFGVVGKTEVVDTTSGDAATGDVMSGKKAWVDGAEVTGTIATRTLSPANDSVAEGYYAATNLTQVDADLATANIKAGTTIFGVVGKTEVVDTTSGDAVAGEVMSGKKAWVDGSEVTGTIATRTLSPANDTVAEGYYAATNLTQVDTDLVTANIKAGTTIFGVAGKTEVVDTTSGDAVAGEVMSGKKAWVDGSEVTGTIAAQTLSPANGTVAAGYYAPTNLTQVDADLATANIKAGTTIFGVVGKTEVVDTTSGDAVAGEVMSGKKAWVDGSEVTGTIATRTLSPANDTVAEGYYAATNLTQVDTDLVTANIKDGTTIFGVAGKTEVVDTTSGDAAAGDVMSGKKAWVDGSEVTGTIATRTLSAANSTVAAGYYAATTLTAVDADLATTNIKAGTTIFGVAGKTEVVDTTSGDAAAGDVLSGKKAWVDGAEVTGNIATRTLSATTSTVAAGYYAATTLTAVDTDFAAWNIRKDVTVFGIAGSSRSYSYVGTNRYLDNGDGTVIDQETGLMWTKNSYHGNMNWAQATAYCSNLVYAGYDDWRLPSVYKQDGPGGPIAVPELDTVGWSGGIPGATPFTAPGDPFENIGPATIRWSSITRAEDSNAAWMGFITLGSQNYQPKTWYTGVWPVRGLGSGLERRTLSDTTTVVKAGYYSVTNLTQVDADLLAQNIREGVTLFGIVGASRYYDNGDGTVTDPATGLMWTKNANHGYMVWTAAVAYCENLVYAGYDDWHLPSVNQDGGSAELDTLGRPGGNPTNTPFTKPGIPFTNVGYYPWSSTTSAANSNNAWYVDFDYGSGACADDKTCETEVWPVRRQW